MTDKYALALYSGRGLGSGAVVGEGKDAKVTEKGASVHFLSKRSSVLPGFAPAMGLTLVYLSLIVLIPICAVFIKTATLTWPQFWSTVTAPRVLASYRLSFGASFIAEALAIADRIAVMNEGRIEQVASADELRRSPGTPFVSEFLQCA